MWMITLCITAPSSIGYSNEYIKWPYKKQSYEEWLKEIAFWSNQLLDMRKYKDSVLK